MVARWRWGSSCCWQVDYIARYANSHPLKGILFPKRGPLAPRAGRGLGRGAGIKPP